MRLIIDTDAKTLDVEDAAGPRRLDLYGVPAFELLSDLWLKTSWNAKYSYTFTWMGRPIIQHPEDMIRLAEAIYTLQPDVIIETGVAHGGSLVFYAGLMTAIGRGRVVGVDIEIRPHNRAAIEAHPMASRITLIEGSSTDPAVVAAATAGIQAGERVMVILDSNHSYAHVRAELDAYAPAVTIGSYLLATDGIMRDVADAPRGQPDWITDNPAKAAEDWAATRADFVLSPPAWAFNESPLAKPITGWPSAWLRRVA